MSIAQQPSAGHSFASPSGSSNWRPAALAILALFAVVGVVFYGVSQLSTSSNGPTNKATLTHSVARGDLLITVTEDGNLESAVNLDVKCQVAGGSSILWIVKDGSEVKKDDRIVLLDSSALVDQINQQKINLNKADAARIQAKKEFDAAEIAVQEYEEGLFPKELADHEMQVTIAQETLTSAQNSLDHTDRMFKKGYVSALERKSQEFAVQRAGLELKSAQKAQEVLERFTKRKTLEDLKSKRDTADAKAKSEQAAFELEDTRLKRLEKQLANCEIVAPGDGMVVFANESSSSRSRSSSSVSIEEGALVREKQTLLRLPDLANMQVKCAVHESKVDQLKRGMRARIRILERELQGTVVMIANQPEPSSWFSSSVKEYATFVKIDGQPGGLKPGMTAEVEILVNHVQNVLTVPVASVVEQNGKFFAWVQKGLGAPERRPLVLGPSNDKFIIVEDGVTEGEAVVLNPRAVIAEAREQSSEKEAIDIKQRFGDAPPGALQETPNKPAPRRPPGAGGPGGRPPRQDAT